MNPPPMALLDKPIVEFFKCLIKNDNKKKIVLSDSQILEILEKELNIDISKTHELAVDIYLNAIKSFLKDWPDWEEFDKMIENLKGLSNSDLFNIIYRKYISFRVYLMKITEMIKPHINNVVKPLDVVKKQKVSPDICMEVNCTRSQLNNIILKWPLDNGQTNTIFNMGVSDLRKPEVFTLPSILNWWNVSVSIIFTDTIIYKKDVVHKLDHVLINTKQRTAPKHNEKIIKKLQYRDVEGSSQSIPKKVLLDMIVNFHKTITTKNYKEADLEIAFAVLRSLATDLSVLPDILKIPNNYRRYLSDYPYVRLLSRTPEMCKTKCNYDLSIMETLTPCHEFMFQMRNVPSNVIPTTTDWFSIECKECNIKFDGVKSVPSLLQHFKYRHGAEPFWNCANCDTGFSMALISSNKWHHDCFI